MIHDLSRARRDGSLANDDAVLGAVESRVGDGEGMRAVDLKAWNGVHLRVLPDRGLDIGTAWYCGTPLAWVSPIGESGPRDDLEGFDWSESFGGGLLVTCGLRNVGMPSEGHGLHGTFSHLNAREVQVERDFGGECPSIAVGGKIVDDADPVLSMERTIRTYLGHGRVEVTDRITNEGSRPAEAPLLYHLNFGYPFWGPGATLSIPTTKVIPRDGNSTPAVATWERPEEPREVPERVLEHEIVPEDGWGRVTVANHRLDVSLTIGWRLAELPRLHQWIDPSPGMYVLGIEPANCSTRGRAHDRAEGRLPEISAGETRETRLVFEVGPP